MRKLTFKRLRKNNKKNSKQRSKQSIKKNKIRKIMGGSWGKPFIKKENNVQSGGWGGSVPKSIVYSVDNTKNQKDRFMNKYLKKYFK